MRPQPQAAPSAQPQTQAEFNGEQWLADLLKNPAAMKPVKFKPFQSDTDIELTAALVIRWFCTPTKQGHRCTVDQAVKFLKLCEARKLNPWEGDAYLVGYDSKDGPVFSLITAHQAFLKRAEAHPAFDGMRSGVMVRLPDGTIHEQEGDYVDDGQTLVGAWSKVYRTDRKHETYRRIKLSAYAKPFGVWNTNAPGMIVKCAEADGLRSTFPNVLGGMYVDGEMLGDRNDDATPEPKRTTIAGLKSAPRQPVAIQQHTPAPAPVVVQQPEPEPEEDPFAGVDADPVDGGIGGELFGKGQDTSSIKG